MDVHKQLSQPNTKVEELYVLACLMPNVDKNTWNTLCAAAPNIGWCALQLQVDPARIKVPQLPTNLPIDFNDSLIDPILFANFFQQLNMEVDRAVRSNSPLALACFANANNSKKNTPSSTPILQKAVQQYGGACDFLGNIDTEHMGLILPGAKIFKAQNIVEDIVAHCAKENVILKAGIAGNIGKNCNSTSLIDQANKALKDTQNFNVRTYKEPSTDLDATLVHSHEKRFLFGGIK